MEKYGKFLPLALFWAIAGKALIVADPSFTTILALAALAGYNLMASKYENSKEYQALEEKMQAQSKQIEQLALELKEVKTHVGASKLSQATKPNQAPFKF